MTERDKYSVLHEAPLSDTIATINGLLTQSSRVFLIGAGCSKCAELPLMAELTEKTLQDESLDTTTKEILGGIKSRFDGTVTANIEDYLSELIDFLAIADRREFRKAEDLQVLLGTTPYDASQLRSAVEQIKHGIANIISKEAPIDTHLRFVQALHRTRRVGKISKEDRVDYLVLNYDTLIEDSLAVACVPFSDGFEGGATGWWSPATFEREDLGARVIKLHGSIDWCEFENDPLPRRVGNQLKPLESNKGNILIWPASTKYRETRLDPYAQLTDLFRQSLPPKRNSQCILVICGYGFGDAHINSEIDQALRESNGQLTILAFTSEGSPSGQLGLWHEDENVSNQVWISAGEGFFHGRKKFETDSDLELWKFENLTRLLEGTL